MLKFSQSPEDTVLISDHNGVSEPIWMTLAPLDGIYASQETRS